MFERFSDRARRVLVLAQEEARLLGHNHIGTEHLLLGLIHEGDGVAARVLASLGADLVSTRAHVSEVVPAGDDPPGPSPPFTRHAKAVLERSLREAMLLGHDHIGTEHLLLAIAEEGAGVGAQVLATLGVGGDVLRERVRRLLAGSEPGPAWRRAPADPPVCPRCRMSLAATAAYRLLDVPPGDGEGDGGDGTLRLAVPYCKACGTALAAGFPTGRVE